MSKELTTEEYYNELWLENKELIQENIDRLNKKRFAQALMLAEKDKEIERLNNLLKETSQILSEQTTKAITLKSENKRLNNIINELEHHLYQEWLEWKDSDCESIYSRAGEDKAIYDYLQELKGSEKE